MRPNMIKPLLLASVILLGVLLVRAPPPSPHSISGYIFESDGVTQVQLGTNYSINDTTGGDYVRSITTLPIPELSGWYFELMTGTDGDQIVVNAWNASHYGETAVILNGDMENVNVIISQPRQPETNVSVTSPDNDAKVNMSFYFNLTARIGMLMGNGTGCNASIGFNNTAIIGLSPAETALHQLGEINLSEVVDTSWNLSPTAEGRIRITVETLCQNTGYQFENLYRNEIDLTIQDVIPPNVTLISPGNNSWRRENTSFTFNVTDSTGIANCSIYLDGNLNMTNTTVSPGTLQNFTLSNISEGSHTWLVSCFDNSTNSNQGNSTAFTINIDKTPPSVTLLLPADYNVSTSNNITFNYSVSENLVLANCSFLINGVVDQANTSLVQQNMPQSFNKTFARGNYSWSVSCEDATGNTGTPAERLFNVTDPDLTVNSTGIVPSSYYPIENEIITINATIHNIGDENATNFTVQFFENDPESGGAQIGSNFTLNLSAGSTTSLNVSWAAKVGIYDFQVRVDTPLATNGTVAESNESNNIANMSLIVAMWHFYYGKVTSDILLETATNGTVYRWNGATNMSQNLYATDSDSSINWSGLLALGLNSTGNLSMQDFETADIALNTTYSDSVNLTYTSAGQRKNVTTFTIFGMNVLNVSIAPSTNNTNFTTGILWDASDPGFGQYDGTQDIVFVTKVNVDSKGTYGMYDYEIRVPAKLQAYKQPNLQDTVTFYTEIS